MNQRTLLYTLPDFGVGGGQTILLRTAAALSTLRPDLRQIVVGAGGGPMLEQFEREGLDCRVLGDGGRAAAPGGARAAGAADPLRAGGWDLLVQYAR